MSHEEILRMCRSLARKYNDPQEYDDLVQEGVIKVLSMIEAGRTDKRLLYSHAQSVMNHYYNLGRRPVYIPAGGNAHSMTAGQQASNWTSLALQNALYGETIEPVEYVSEAPSTEGIFEQKEYLDYVLKVASNVLSELELNIIHLRYWQNLSQDEVGVILNKNKMWVSRKEIKALETIRNNL